MPERADCVAITLNGEALSVPAGTTLASLVSGHGDADSAVATAVNGDFVPRAIRATTVLAPGDAVSFLKAIVGG